MTPTSETKRAEIKLPPVVSAEEWEAARQELLAGDEI